MLRESLKRACVGLLVAGVCLCTNAVLSLNAYAFEVDDSAASELPAYIDESIPDDAMLISSEYALLSSGEVVSVADGSTVTDPDVVGTENEPPDPLAISGATRYERVTIAEAREQIASMESSDAESDVSLLSLDNYNNAYWGTYNGESAFYDSDGNMFVCQAKGVIDVSEHNGTIDWAAAKKDGVEGAIIRIGFGTDRADYKAAYNISECKRLGIPFGVYLYSYAENSEITGAAEGAYTVSLLKQLGVNPSDLTLPVYYDLEQWSWTGHTPSDNPSVNETITRQWVSALQSAGYKNLAVYSYTFYLKSALNSTYIHSLTNWVAQYGYTGQTSGGSFNKMTYTDFKTVFRGWQYSSSGSVNGISGSVDLNAFGNATWSSSGGSWASIADYDGDTLSGLGTKLTNVAEGDYYLISALGGVGTSANSVIEVNGSSNGSYATLGAMTGSKAQLIHIKANGDGTYTLKAASGNVLDASGPSCLNGTAIIQWPSSGAKNQKWEFYQDSAGWCYIASTYAGSHNKVMSVSGGSALKGVQIVLGAASSGTNSQRFRLVKSSDYKSGKSGWVTEDGEKHWYDGGIRAEGKEFYDPSTNAWYWADMGGAIAKDKDVWMPDSKKWVRYDSNGKMIKGEDCRYGGWYYFDKTTGAMTKGVVYVSSNGGKWVYYDVVTGKMAHGEAYLNYDSSHTGWYYFDSVTGAMAHGVKWLSSNGGKWVYYDWTTGKMAHGLQCLSYDSAHTGWYYFDPATGKMAHGTVWVPERNDWRTFDAVTGKAV